MSVPVISTVVLGAHWVIVVGLSIRVIMRRPRAGVAVAWLAVMFSVPFAGAVLYLLFGEKRLGRQRAARVALSIPALEEWQHGLRSTRGSAGQPIAHHAERVLGFPAVAGNTLELLTASGAVFDRMVTDIDSATTQCHACFYIWQEGGRVMDIVEALLRAARRGVQCRALADAFGSEAFLRSDVTARLRTAGVEVVAALPMGPIRALVARADLRNHRKIVVIDDRVAYAGSQNLVDPRIFKRYAGVGEWVDAMVRLEGPAVTQLDAVFRLDWAVETGQPFKPPPTVPGSFGTSSSSMVQIVPSGPDLRPEAIRQLLLTVMYAARRKLVMTTPYFVPDEAMVTALLSAACRGVEVLLIVPAQNNSFLVRHASVAHFDDLMSAGVQIALFKGGLLHTKSLTIDGEISIFGSVNLDMRSLWLNFEISLFAYDPAFTGRLGALQEAYEGASDRLRLDQWRGRPAWRRFVENSCRLIGPLL